MTGVEIKNLFLDKGALLEGHFQLTSGRHSNMYLQCALLLQYPEIAEKLGKELASRIRGEDPGFPKKLDVVCAPALGGIVFGHVVAHALGARFIFAERENGNGPLKLRRGFSIRPGETALVVEDVITTGGSLKEVAELVKNAGGKLVGVGAVAERSNSPVDFGVSKTVLLKLALNDYLPSDCPFCKEGKPVEKPGSRSSSTNFA